MWCFLGLHFLLQWTVSLKSSECDLKCVLEGLFSQSMVIIVFEKVMSLTCSFDSSEPLKAHPRNI